MISFLAGVAMLCVALIAPGVVVGNLLDPDDEHTTLQEWLIRGCIALGGLAVVIFCLALLYAGVRCAIWGFW